MQIIGREEDIDLRGGRCSLAGVASKDGRGKGTAIGIRARDHTDANARGRQQVGGDGGWDGGQRGGDAGYNRVAVGIGGSDGNDCGDRAGYSDGDGWADGINGTLESLKLRRVGGWNDVGEPLGSLSGLESRVDGVFYVLSDTGSAGGGADGRR